MLRGFAQRRIPYLRGNNGLGRWEFNNQVWTNVHKSGDHVHAGKLDELSGDVEKDFIILPQSSLFFSTVFLPCLSLKRKGTAVFLQNVGTD